MTARHKKALHPSPPSVRQAPRAIAPAAPEARGYPSVADLVSSSSEWKGWLEGTLRAMLRPVAIAGAIGAIGLAATGCESGSDAGALAPCANPYVTMTPMPPALPAPLLASTTPVSVQPAGGVVMTALPSVPEPAPSAPTHRRRRIHPTTQPVAMPGQAIAVMPNPPDIEGDIAYVHP